MAVITYYCITDVSRGRLITKQQNLNARSTRVWLNANPYFPDSVALSMSLTKLQAAIIESPFCPMYMVAVVKSMILQLLFFSTNEMMIQGNKALEATRTYRDIWQYDSRCTLAQMHIELALAIIYSNQVITGDKVFSGSVDHRRLDMAITIFQKYSN